LQKYNHDGIVIEWSSAYWKSDLMDKYVELLKALKTNFLRNNFTLGTIVAAKQPGYDLKRVTDIVDFVSVQTLGYHGSWNTQVGHSSALEDQKQSMNDWLNSGADPAKLLVTVPFYGTTWTLADTTKTDLGAKAKGPGVQGPWTKFEGKISFNELQILMKESPMGWSRHVDDDQGAISYYKGDQWISIDDATTAKAKSNWFTSHGFGGVTVVAINNDDFKALASPTKHPLLKAINEGLNKKPVVHPGHN